MVHDLNKRKPPSRLEKRSAARQLAQQKADFTAEGSPPTGLVATQVPVTGAEAAQPLVAADTRVQPADDSRVPGRTPA